jgi:hypothetical protein
MTALDRTVLRGQLRGTLELTRAHATLRRAGRSQPGQPAPGDTDDNPLPLVRPAAQLRAQVETRETPDTFLHMACTPSCERNLHPLTHDGTHPSPQPGGQDSLGGGGVSPVGRMGSVAWGGGEPPIGPAGQLPAPLMDRPMMRPAEQGQIGQVGGAAVQPVDQMVALAPGQRPIAVGEHTAPRRAPRGRCVGRG